MAAEATVRKFKAFIKKYKKMGTGDSVDISKQDLNETPHLGPASNAQRGTFSNGVVIIEGNNNEATL